MFVCLVLLCDKMGSERQMSPYVRPLTFRAILPEGSLSRTVNQLAVLHRKPYPGSYTLPTYWQTTAQVRALSTSRSCCVVYTPPPSTPPSPHFALFISRSTKQPRWSSCYRRCTKATETKSTRVFVELSWLSPVFFPPVPSGSSWQTCANLVGTRIWFLNLYAKRGTSFRGQYRGISKRNAIVQSHA